MLPLHILLNLLMCSVSVWFPKEIKPETIYFSPSPTHLETIGLLKSNLKEQLQFRSGFNDSVGFYGSG